MNEIWPEALANNLIDDSLARDLVAIGHNSPSIDDRFLALGRYAASSSDERSPTEGIMFTCSAFRSSIERVKADLAIPAITPNEGAFDEALALCSAVAGGGTLGLLLTFESSVASLTMEIGEIAKAAGQLPPSIVPVVAEGALAALQAGYPEDHDRLSAEASDRLPPVDVIVIGQFSMARAAASITGRRPETVLTTPQSAARKIRRLVEARRAGAQQG